jgi:hypothetical protein
MQVQMAGLHSLMMAAQRTMGTARTENADLRVQLALMQVHDGQKNAEIARLRGAVAEKITLAQIMADNENAEQNSGEWRLA